MGSLSAVALFVLVGGCENPDSQGPARISAMASKASSEGVVFTAEETAKASKGAPMLELQPPYWSPTDADIDVIRSALRDHLATSTGQQAEEILESIDDYRFQYFGVTHQGQRAVMVNAFCSEHWRRDTEWTNAAVVVLDGGSCYFRFVVARDSGVVLMFEVSGEA